MKSHRRLSSPENPANFLIMIPSDDTQSTGIEIPEKFREKHGKDLLEKVILKVPNGDVWQVDLEKSNSDIWFKNGWGEFATHYGIKFAYLLMFKYEGFSMFSVLIFKPNSLEIIYPNNTIKDDATKASVSCDEVEIIDIEDDTCSSETEDQDYDEGEHSKKRQKIIQRMEDSRTALDKANANFKCDKPYFIVYMHKSYLTKSGAVIPIEFRGKLLRGKNSLRCSLQIENNGKQKTWEVVARNANMGNADWLMFLEDNAIRVGDVIAFKLISKHQNVLGVTIFRSNY